MATEEVEVGSIINEFPEIPAASRSWFGELPLSIEQAKKAHLNVYFGDNGT